jgi:hypothetical protein
MEGLLAMTWRRVIASRRRGNLKPLQDCFSTVVPRNDIWEMSLRAFRQESMAFSIFQSTEVTKNL